MHDDDNNHTTGPGSGERLQTRLCHLNQNDMLQLGNQSIG